MPTDPAYSLLTNKEGNCLTAQQLTVLKAGIEGIQNADMGVVPSSKVDTNIDLSTSTIIDMNIIPQLSSLNITDTPTAPSSPQSKFLSPTDLITRFSKIPKFDSLYAQNYHQIDPTGIRA